MNELFEKFPELIKSLLEKISQSDYGNSKPEMKAARDKLLSRLHGVMEEISHLQHQEPNSLTEEQIKKLIDMPRPLPPSMQWKIKPRKKSGGDNQD
jgi:hypothetical protein